ncbi:MAG: D-alanyl-D-alanine carboxypeptidase/D-alanyl-D-alanine-endopeptidase [Nitriliruptoraceae bacterium]
MSTHRAEIRRASLLLVVTTLCVVTGAQPAVGDSHQHPGAALVDTWVDAVRAVDTATWSIVVLDESGNVRFAHDATRGLLPASTLKIVTAAAAVTALGPDATFVTRVEAQAPPTDGTVIGDLALVGGWDPTLATDAFSRWAYPDRPAARLAQLADRIVAAGVDRVTGGVVATARPDSAERLAPGWPERYLDDLDARYNTGLTIDAGLRVEYQWPEGAEPPSVAPSGTNDDTSPQPDKVIASLSLYPELRAALELDELLRARGVDIGARPRRARSPAPPRQEIARLVSPPLRAMVENFVRTSDNHLADTVFRALGVAQFDDASWEAGGAATRDALHELGVDLAGSEVVDGSGLSRDNRLSARTLADVDQRMWVGDHAGTWKGALAVAGESGTLRRRLTGSVAEGRFQGKTGSLRDVMAISGAIDGSTRRLHVAVIINDVSGTDRQLARAAIDRTLELLTVWADGCEVQIAAPEDAQDLNERVRSPGALTAVC